MYYYTIFCSISGGADDDVTAITTGGPTMTTTADAGRDRNADTEDSTTDDDADDYAADFALLWAMFPHLPRSTIVVAIVAHSGDFEDAKAALQRAVDAEAEAKERGSDESEHGSGRSEDGYRFVSSF